VKKIRQKVLGHTGQEHYTQNQNILGYLKKKHDHLMCVARFVFRLLSFTFTQTVFAGTWLHITIQKNINKNGFLHNS